MHEYALTRQIIQTAETYARSHGATAVTAIELVIGEEAGCVAESLALYFDLIAEGTICDGATLKIERVKPMLQCDTCGQYFARKPFSFDCPQANCGGEGRPTEIGREFLVRAIEIKKTTHF